MSTVIRWPGRPAASSLYLTVDGRCTGFLARRAATFASRAVGLLGSPEGIGRVAIEIRPCSAVHTLGMRYAIDVAFVDAQGRVQRLVPALPAWRFAWSPGAAACWEMPCGSARMLRIGPGVHLQAAFAPGASVPGPFAASGRPRRGAAGDIGG